MTDERCENCRFAQTITKIDYFDTEMPVSEYRDEMFSYKRCRRLPPTVNLRASYKGTFVAFPIVSIDWWCGEWQAKA